MKNKKQSLTLEQFEQLKTKHLTKINKDKHGNYVNLNIESYELLSWKLENLLGVCQSALYFLSENRNTQLNDVEHKELYKTCPMEVMNVLQIAKDLIPHEELELLDKLN